MNSHPNSLATSFRAWMKAQQPEITPHAWQVELGDSATCTNRLIRVPTGMGKTLGVLSAWAYNRVVRVDDTWPHRLVWCLPMRTLVEQTRDVARALLAPLNVKVHVLMGGEEAEAWHLHPEADAVLVGTQDMLLSRALNRGYAAPRARWPMEFGLLNSDCLWVMDEVQLMDVGLATSAQLQQFREDDRSRTPRPSCTWWMSATLQPEWLKSVDTRALVETLQHQTLAVAEADRQGVLWTDVSKPLHLEACLDEKALASLVATKHQQGQTTLVIVNTVKRAVAVHDALKKQRDVATDVRLVHSRFRPYERRQWREAFLNRNACAHADRIVVATQVVEAGVDISAAVLVTDLAPWSSLVQRFGRAARYGGRAQVYVVDIDDEKKTLPYAYADLLAARTALKRLDNVSVRALEGFHTSLTVAETAALYPYSPEFLLLRKELDELFDTTPDLTGADLDISRFIRSGDERDCQVFWRDFDRSTPPGPECQPRRDELCSVPIGDFMKWLKDAPKDQGPLFWQWDYLDGAWLRATARDIRPGAVVLVRADAGGYSPVRGFDPRSDAVEPVPAAPLASPLQNAEAAQDDESLACAETWQTIAEHGLAVARQVAGFGGLDATTDASLRRTLDLAARWHDIGKVHPAFVSLLKTEPPPPFGEVAKAPDTAWRLGRPCYAVPAAAGDDRRPGFRHELASALALLDALRQANPAHAALLGPWRELLAVPDVPVSQEIAGVQRILNDLDAASLDLLLYLITAHHGKVRLGFHATPADQEHPVAREGDTMPIRGIMEGDALPPVLLSLPEGGVALLPATTLTLEPAAIGLSPLTGASWSERCAALQKHHGAFTLAWLEALLRAADIRASKEIQS